MRPVLCRERREEVINPPEAHPVWYDPGDEDIPVEVKHMILYPYGMQLRRVPNRLYRLGPGKTEWPFPPPPIMEFAFKEAVRRIQVLFIAVPTDITEDALEPYLRRARPDLSIFYFDPRCMPTARVTRFLDIPEIKRYHTECDEGFLIFSFSRRALAFIRSHDESRAFERYRVTRDHIDTGELKVMEYTHHEKYGPSSPPYCRMVYAVLNDPRFRGRRKLIVTRLKWNESATGRPRPNDYEENVLRPLKMCADKLTAGRIWQETRVYVCTMAHVSRSQPDRWFPIREMIETSGTSTTSLTAGDQLYGVGNFVKREAYETENKDVWLRAPAMSMEMFEGYLSAVFDVIFAFEMPTRYGKSEGNAITKSDVAMMLQASKRVILFSQLKPDDYV